MGRYIDADTLYVDVKAECNPYGKPTISFDDGCKVLDMIRRTPTADVAPVIHAHWVRWKEPKVTNPVYKCSNCDFDITVDKHPNVSIGFWIFDFRYCLNCGAKMDDSLQESEE